jgi:uncharacterized membrane protein YccF (DUF307 family)
MDGEATRLTLRESNDGRTLHVMLRALGNIIWFVFGGLVLAIAWVVAGIVMAITIVGIPWAKSCFVIAQFTLWPFGREAVDRRDLTGRTDIGTGALGFLGNVVWFLVAGLWLAIGHIASALACAITIIGIPFAVQHLKLAMVSLAPIGKSIVLSDDPRLGR